MWRVGYCSEEKETDVPTTRYTIRDVEGGYVDSGSITTHTGPSVEDVVGKAADITAVPIANIFDWLIGKLLFSGLIGLGFLGLIVGSAIGGDGAVFFWALGLGLIVLGQYRRSQRKKRSHRPQQPSLPTSRPIRITGKALYADEV